MRRNPLLTLGLALMLFPPLAAQALEPVRHDLRVVVEPAQQRLRAVDTLHLPPGRPRTVDFVLHQGLDPAATTEGVGLESFGPLPGMDHLTRYRASLPAGVDAFTLSYGGTIHHPPELYGEEHARGMRVSAGTIGADGVYLAGESGWYPRTEGLVTFRLRVELPPGWEGVSQGGRTEHGQAAGGTAALWEVAAPQEEIYLVAAPFAEYSRPAGAATAMVFLRAPDPALAGRYLEATIRYLQMYERLIGPYPYGKFALVENFWETGYGMPSFTLLGPRVLRFPFILTSSYPHEILHNWWGNGVYPDYGRGNWAEGLTAYLADHLLKEEGGEGEEYRQTTLQKYADYVRAGRDFPLREFLGRHSSASEAVGYGKAMMVFHMLRLRLGDETFVAGPRDFYRRWRFRFASWDDLRQSFETVSGEDLGPFFSQWLDRAGAPELTVRAAPEKGDGKGGHRLRLTLEQRQSGPAYSLRVPVAVTLAGEEQAFATAVEMTAKVQEAVLELPGEPVRVDVDPRFDLFRRLHREETPPALSQALGAERLLLVLPAASPAGMQTGYRQLAEALGRSGAGRFEVVTDSELDRLPADSAVILLGWENRFLPAVEPVLKRYGVSLGGIGVRIGDEELRPKRHSAALVGRLPESPGQALAWVAAGSAEALPGLARKLPHYHKYSYLGFDGEEPVNILKGRWPVLASPLTVFLQGQAAMGKLPPRPPLTEIPSPPQGG